MVVHILMAAVLIKVHFVLACHVLCLSAKTVLLRLGLDAVGELLSSDGIMAMLNAIWMCSLICLAGLMIVLRDWKLVSSNSRNCNSVPTAFIFYHTYITAE